MRTRLLWLGLYQLALLGEAAVGFPPSSQNPLPALAQLPAASAARCNAASHLWPLDASTVVTAATSSATDVVGSWTLWLPHGAVLQAGGGLQLQRNQNQYGSLPAASFGGPSTFVLWVAPSQQTVGTWARFFDFGNGSSAYPDGTVFAAANGLFCTYLGVSQSCLSLPSPLPFNTWTHLAFTIDGFGAAAAYVNGVAAASGQLHPLSPGVRTSNFVGRSNWNAPLYDGGISSLMIADSQLTFADVVGLYSGANCGTRPPPRPPPPVSRCV